MPLTEYELEELKKCLTKGLLEEEIAACFFVTLPFIRKNIEKVMKKSKITEEDVAFARIKKLLEDGKKITEIKKMSGLPPEKVIEVFKKIEEEEKKGKNERKVRKRREKDKKLLKKRVAKVLDVCLDTPAGNLLIRQYIDFCKKEYMRKEFLIEDLDFLGECIEFILGGAKDIQFFCKVCISFGEYKRANAFILNNINNPGISKEEKKDLMYLQKNIVYSIRKENAVNLFLSGVTNAKKVAEQAGILEIDAIKIKKGLSENNKEIESGNSKGVK